MNKSFFALTGALILGLAGIGCGGGSSSKNDQGGGQPGYYNYPSLTPAEVRELTKNSSVDCPAGDCHPAVGMFVRSEGTTIYTCTAFLVAPDKAVTNGHCLSDDLAHAGADCSDVLITFGPNEGYGTELIGCSKVLAVSKPPQSDRDKSQIDQDYAVLALASSSRRPPLSLRAFPSPGAKGIETARAAFSGSNIYAVDPDDSTILPTGHLRKAACQPLEHTLYMPDATYRSPTLSFGPCDLVHGNSGSPVVTTDGAVWAVVHSSVTPWQSLIDALKPFQLDPATPPRNLTFGTTLACIPALASGVAGQPLPECAAGPASFADIGKNYKTLFAQFNTPEGRAKIEATASESLDLSALDLASGGGPYTWKPRLGATEAIGKVVLAANPDWSRDKRPVFIETVAPSCVKGDMASPQSMQTSVRFLGTRVALTPWLQLGFEPASVGGSVPAVVEFHPGVHAAPAKVVIKQNSSDAGTQPVIFEADIQACTGVSNSSL